MAGRIEAWRQRLDERARARRARFAELDGQLREAVERREVPRPARMPMPAPGTLPDEVAVLVDDGQVRRAESLLANLTGAGTDEVRTAVAAYVRRRRP
ncbi:MAG TPA: hypothetical protein VFU19_13400 [Iamia sp.]|nr:hypothetical protein [Iamia sp.]